MNSHAESVKEYQIKNKHQNVMPTNTTLHGIFTLVLESLNKTFFKTYVIASMNAGDTISFRNIHPRKMMLISYF